MGVSQESTLSVTLFSNKLMNGVLRHVDSYTDHVVRASSLIDDNNFKGEHLQIKHIEKWKERDKRATNTVHLVIKY